MTYYRLLLFLSCAAFAVSLQAQTLTIAGGQTIRVATKHDAFRVEGNFDWKPDFWSSDSLRMSLHHAVSASYFTDINDVYAVSWAPNFILTGTDRNGLYPYLQFGIGVALLSDDKFESRDDDPYDDGTSDMGSNGQFENSVALGLINGSFGIRAKYYHYSNAGLANPNGGIDVAELGISYIF